MKVGCVGWQRERGARAGAEALPRARYAVAPVLLATRIFYTTHHSTLFICFSMMQKISILMQTREPLWNYRQFLNVSAFVIVGRYFRTVRCKVKFRYQSMNSCKIFSLVRLYSSFFIHSK